MTTGSACATSSVSLPDHAGHMRHEVGHYYWQVLVSADEPRLSRYRERFGDERVDYNRGLGAALLGGDPPAGLGANVRQHLRYGSPVGRLGRDVRPLPAYPDALQTAASFGVSVDPAVVDPEPRPAGPSSGESIEDIIADWIPLAGALNAINRSMGHPDAYPFVLSPGIIRNWASCTRSWNGPPSRPGRRDSGRFWSIG